MDVGLVILLFHSGILVSGIKNYKMLVAKLHFYKTFKIAQGIFEFF